MGFLVSCHLTVRILKPFMTTENDHITTFPAMGVVFFGASMLTLPCLPTVIRYATWCDNDYDSEGDSDAAY